MKYEIKHEIRGRLRVHLLSKLTLKDFDKLYCYIYAHEFVSRCKVYTATSDLMVEYIGERREIIHLIADYNPKTAIVAENAVTAISASRELNSEYKEKLVRKFVLRMINRFLIPFPIRVAVLFGKSFKYIAKGITSLSKGKLEVSVLDATAIVVSMIRQDFATAGSVMFLLEVGEILEDWTHKKSVCDLAGSMSLNVSKVWLKCGERSVLVNTNEVQKNDEVIVHAGNMIPFDGDVVGGEATVNQSSLTGESIPVKKENGSYVYAGTVVEEGELVISVRKVGGSTRYEKIVSMIEDSEKLKSSVESKAEHLADRLVPYTFIGTGLVWLATRNVMKTLSVLMVDFSCALKLAMPITVLSAIREANCHNITVKGGKFMEKFAAANTIVFDKTGTLTKANPIVSKVIPFCDMHPDELLRIAACLEEHFPHSMANAVVNSAREKNLIHDEMHSKVEYIVAHGIASSIEGKNVLIGSYHFVFEDKGNAVPIGYEEQFVTLPDEYSHLYLCMDGYLAAVICIEDPVREESTDVISRLRESGFENIVMMTGDSKRTAKAIAEKVGVDKYYAEVLPEDKAEFVMREKAKGNTVVMIGDGINDSPALSAADVGVAISDGAEIAREIADITISADNLSEIVTLRKLSKAMMKRIKRNYHSILAINSGLIILGVGGFAQPATTAMLHNASTLAIGLGSMRNLI